MTSGDSVSVTVSCALSETFVWSPAERSPTIRRRGPPAVYHMPVFRWLGQWPQQLRGCRNGDGVRSRQVYGGDQRPVRRISISATDGLSLKVTASGTVALNDDRGGRVLMVGYSSHCLPCRRHLETWQNETSNQALAGQQITATLSGGFPSGTKINSYKWSFTSWTSPNPIKNWSLSLHPTRPIPRRLCRSSLRLWARRSTTRQCRCFRQWARSSYDQTKDTVMVTCTVNLTFPDGTIGTVAAQSPNVQLMLPIAAWTVNIPPPYYLLPLPPTEEPGFYSDNCHKDDGCGVVGPNNHRKSNRL